MKLKIVPYQTYSESARALRRLIPDSKIVSPNSPTYTPSRKHLLLNWGCSKYYRFDVAGVILNAPVFVERASNKLLTFHCFKDKDVSTVEWTVDETVASQWIKEGFDVFARTVLNGTKGKGIVHCHGDIMVDAPLYTKYKKKKKEFRLHIFNGELIDVQEKRRRSGVEEISSMIRNLDNGWVFCHEDVTLPEDAEAEAKKAVIALGLDFGAVDLIWNEKENKSFILEVNTAPGLEGQTLEKYASAIKGLVNANS